MSLTTSQLVRFQDIARFSWEWNAGWDPVGHDPTMIGAWTAAGAGLRWPRNRPTDVPVLDGMTTSWTLSAWSDMLQRGWATATRRHAGADNVGMRFPCLGCLHGVHYNPALNTHILSLHVQHVSAGISSQSSTQRVEMEVVRIIQWSDRARVSVGSRLLSANH